MSKLSDYLVANPTPSWQPRPEILLSPPIPAPMHGLAPRVVLGRKWWDEIRQAVYRSTDFHCIACSVKKRSRSWCQHLEAHECYEIDWLMGTMTYLETVPLCPRCHRYVHPGLALLLKDEGIISVTEYQVGIEQGDAVLRQAELKRLVPYSGPVADWNDWRMIVHTMDVDTRETVILEYPPLFDSAESQMKARAKE